MPGQTSRLEYGTGNPVALQGTEEPLDEYVEKNDQQKEKNGRTGTFGVSARACFRLAVKTAEMLAAGKSRPSQRIACILL